MVAGNVCEYGQAVKRALVLLAAASLVLPWSGAGVAAGAHLPAVCDGTWKRPTALPSLSRRGSTYNDIVAVTTRDVWVVGGSNLDNRRVPRPGAVALRWDGLGWTRTPTPSGGSGDSALLESVDATSPSDVWAIGKRYVRRLEGWYAYAIHWNGATWTMANLPLVRVSRDDSRERITVAGPHDVWAIADRNVTLHLSGSGWQKIRRQKPRQRLWDISSASPRSVWALASFPSGRALLEHWNGRHWELHAHRRVPAGSAGNQEIDRGAIAVDSDSQFMVVGQSYNAHLEDDIASSLSAHGETWGLRPVPIEPYGTVLNEVSDVAWQSRSTAWAVGDWPWTGSYGAEGAYGFIDRWNGHRWTTSWYSGSDHTYFVAVSSAERMTWALGGSTEGGGYFIERHC